jgi:hypothetical protein
MVAVSNAWGVVQVTCKSSDTEEVLCVTSEPSNSSVINDWTVFVTIVVLVVKVAQYIAP